MESRAELKARAKEQLGGGIFSNQWMSGLLVCLIASLIISMLTTSFIGGIIVTGPLGFGLATIFLSKARGYESIEISRVFDGFTKDFACNFLIGLMTNIFILLWGLLFVIPGIVKTYSYSFAYYVKADHPDYTWRQCIDESIVLTSGHKMDLFILDLSFIGWYIVGALCLGIGVLWVVPYHNATKANYYASVAAQTH